MYARYERLHRARFQACLEGKYDRATAIGCAMYRLEERAGWAL